MTEPIEILPHLDVLGNEWVELAMNTDWEKEAEAFADENPDFYGIEHNAQRIVHWLKVHDNAPATCHNLTVAFRECLKAGLLKMRPEPVERTPEPAPNDRAIPHIASTIRMPYTAPDTPENREALKDELRALRQLAPIGKPVSSDLKTLYHKSLIEEREAQAAPVSIAEARAVVGILHPEWTPKAIQFSNEVARLANDPALFAEIASKIPRRNF